MKKSNFLKLLATVTLTGCLYPQASHAEWVVIREFCQSFSGRQPEKTLVEVLKPEHLAHLVEFYAERKPSFNIQVLSLESEASYSQMEIEFKKVTNSTQTPQASETGSQDGSGSYWSMISNAYAGTVGFFSSTTQSVLDVTKGYLMSGKIVGQITYSSAICPAPYLPEGELVHMDLSQSDVNVKGYASKLQLRVCYSYQLKPTSSSEASSSTINSTSSSESKINVLFTASIEPGSLYRAMNYTQKSEVSQNETRRWSESLESLFRLIDPL